MYWENKMKFGMVYNYLEKLYDKVSRKIFEWALMKKTCQVCEWGHR